jgi:hypothetical protein
MQGLVNYTTAYLKNVRACATVYLREKPVHDNGFCYWAKRRLKAQGKGYDAVYDVVGDGHVHGGGYFDDCSGYSTLRAQRVAELRDNLNAELARREAA